MKTEAAVCSRILREALPVGCPKLLVLTQPCGCPQLVVDTAETDVMILYNASSEKLLQNAVAAMAGMAAAERARRVGVVEEK